MFNSRSRLTLPLGRSIHHQVVDCCGGAGDAAERHEMHKLPACSTDAPPTWVAEMEESPSILVAEPSVLRIVASVILDMTRWL